MNSKLKAKILIRIFTLKFYFSIDLEKGFLDPPFSIINSIIIIIIIIIIVVYSIFQKSPMALELPSK